MGDSLGVLIVLVLCGLAAPILLIVGAMVVDLVMAIWMGVSYGHDHIHMPAGLARLVHHGPRTPPR